MKEDMLNDPQDGLIIDEKRSQISQLHISKREFLMWIISCIVATGWGYTQRGLTWGGREITAVINSMNIISQVIALGLPIFLGAGIFFVRPHSRSYMMDLSAKGHSHFYIILRRFLESLVLILLFAIALVLTTFIGPSIEALIFGYNLEIVSFVFFPTALIATCIVMTILLAMGVGLVLAVESLRYAVPLGCTITLFLATFAGWNNYMINHWPARLFVLTSPHNLVKGLAVLLSLLSGYQFIDDSFEVMYLGFEPSWPAMLTALVVFGTIGMLSLAIGTELLKINMKRWPYLPDMVWERNIWERTSQSEDTVTKTKFEKQIQSQKVAAVFIIVIILLSFGFGSTAVQGNLESEANLTLYESPADGETLILGDWLIVQFSTYHPSGITVNVAVSLNILEYHDFPLTFQYLSRFLDMSQSDFLSLNITEQIALCGIPRNRTVDDFNAMHPSISYTAEGPNTHIYVFRMASFETYSSNSTIRYHIEVSQQAD